MSILYRFALAVAVVALSACNAHSGDELSASPKATSTLIATHARQIALANRVHMANEGEYTSDLEVLRKEGLISAPARLKEVSSWELTGENTVIVHLQKGAEQVCSYADKEFAEVLSCADLTVRYSID